MNSIDAGARPPLPHAYPRAEAYARLAHDPLHAALRAFDDEFLAGNREALRDYAAHWVADPLRHWSRRWEYPYVFEQLLRFEEGGRRHEVEFADQSAPRSDQAAAGGGAGSATSVRLSRGNEAAPVAPGDSARGLRILDAGSGLTFFPHFVARELPVREIQCGDRDPAIQRDATRLRPPASPRVRYSEQNLARLDFSGDSFDCVYCISVLEHTADRERIVDEFWRTLRPDGLLVVTIDVSLDGRAEIPREEAARLIQALERRFQPLDAFGAAVAEPGKGVVTTRNVGELAPDLRPPRTYASAGGVARRLLQPRSFPWGRAFRRLVGRGSGGAASELTCFCTAWRKGGAGVPGGVELPVGSAGPPPGGGGA